MRRALIVVFLGVAGTPACANQGDAHQQGLQVATAQKAEVITMAKQSDPHTVPGFQTDSPSQTGLTAETMGDAVHHETSHNAAAQHIVHHARERQTFRIDPQTDPMMQAAKRAVEDPQGTMGEAIVEEAESSRDKDEVVTCDEGGDPYPAIAYRRRHVTLKITPEQIHETWSCGGYRYFECSSTKCYGGCFCGNRAPNRTSHHPPKSAVCRSQGCMTGYQRIVIPEKIEEIEDRWQDDATPLENLVDQGLCEYEAMVCADPHTVKMIQDRPITKDCWTLQKIYRCWQGNPHGCEALRAQGCIQTASTCQETKGDVCVQWRQTYQCPGKKKGMKRYHAKGEASPFCFTGDCVDASYTANGEMLQALSHLTVLREVQNDLRTVGSIFKGMDKSCRKHPIDFLDCCQTAKGWGKSLGLSACRPLEKELGELRKKKRCVRVGTYCAKKVLGVCVTKKTSFCCFGTKLSTLIQEQGRAQLGIGWGSPKTPDCRGLTPDELSRMDFSKLDLSELYADIQASVKPPSADHMAKGAELERIRMNMTTLASKTLSEKQKESQQ